MSIRTYDILYDGQPRVLNVSGERMNPQRFLVPVGGVFSYNKLPDKVTINETTKVFVKTHCILNCLAVYVIEGATYDPNVDKPRYENLDGGGTAV